MHLLRLSSALGVALILFFLVSVPRTLHGQQTLASVQCGTILEAELTQENSQHTYEISLRAGDTLYVRTEVVGSAYRLDVGVYDTQRNRIGGFNNKANGELSVSVSSSNPHRFTIAGAYRRIGAYTLYIGCTLRDGTVIAPGDASSPTPTSSISAPVPTLPPGTPGFPGLAPVDMSNAMTLPLIVGTPMTGIVTTTGNEMLGFTLDAEAGDVVELSFRKLSGNLNLGVVVLSPDNRVVFYGGLVLSDSLSTRFTLQDAGQYTIGVYRADLLPPAASEATAFQVEGSLVS